MSKLRCTLLLGLALVAVGVLASVAVGDLSGIDWSEFVPDDEAVLLSARTWGADEDLYTDVKAVRGPIVGGMCNVEARVETHDLTLEQIRFLVADDTNSNGAIDPAEWVVVGTAAPTLQGTMMVATTGPVLVPATKDAYRIEHTWTGWGVSCDDLLESDLE
jgi:hypothetical protein